MKHLIYSIHTVCSSRWAKGYMEFYMTDVEHPTKDNPVMSVIVLQVGETDERFNRDKELYQPSSDIPVRITRAIYNSKEVGYSIKEQKGYILNIQKKDIISFIKDCEINIDLLLEDCKSYDVDDPKFVSWKYQVSKG
jgi:hypothetical protein